MNMDIRINAVMAGWADAGDDVPEELRLIRELRAANGELADALRNLVAFVYRNSTEAGETREVQEAEEAISKAEGNAV
jgi:hypothetical protein